MRTKVLFLALVYGICLQANVAFAQSQLYPFQDKNGLWGFQEYVFHSNSGKDTEKVRIKAEYEAVSEYWLNDICAVKKNGKWGFVNRKGEVVLPFQYDDAVGQYVSKNGKWGTIDDKGNTKIPFNYAVLKGGGGLTIASEDGTHFGYLDEDGKVVIPLMYEECMPFDGDLNIVKTATGYEMGNSSAYALVKYKGKWGMIDHANKYFLYPKFEIIWAFSANDRYTWVSKNGNDYGAIDRSGQFVLPFYFSSVGSFDDNGEATATAYRYNNGQVSQGTVDAVNQSYNDRVNVYSYKNIEQDYLTESDSVEFGLLANTPTVNYVDNWIKSYQQEADGYLAFLIAEEYLSDTSKHDLIQEGLAWLRKGHESDHDILCANYLSDIYMYGMFNIPQDQQTGFSILNETMTEITDNPTLLESYDDKVSDIDEAYYVAEELLGGFSSLGTYYLKGIGTEKNVVDAVVWYIEGTYYHDALSGYILGDLYYKGEEGVEQNFEEALRYYEFSANDGFIESKYKTAVMYLEGVGTVPDREKAVAYLKEAAEMAHSQSIELLGKLGEN